MATRTNWADRVFSKDMFKIEFGRALNDKRDLTEMDMNVLLTYLSRDKQQIAYDGQVNHVTRSLLALY